MKDQRSTMLLVLAQLNTRLGVLQVGTWHESRRCMKWHLSIHEV